MSAVLDYLNLCRLCLVKDKVNIAIFDETSDVRQLFLKISACLPVKVAQDDRLPKKICDSCLYKVDLLYQFWNTTISSEKQLLQWCGGGSGGEGVAIKASDDTLMLPQSHAHPHSIHTETIILKEERLDSADTKLVDDEYGPDMSTPTATVSANDLYSEEFALSYQQQQQLTEATSNYTSSAANQAQKKRPRGRPPGSTKKKRQSTRSKARRDSVDDSDDDRPLAAVISEPEDHLNSAAGLQITKKEAESDEDYVDNSESLEPTTFVAVPSTSACELPGPSGIVAKGTSTSTEPGTDPLDASSSSVPPMTCKTCGRHFTDRTKFSRHWRIHAPRTIPCDICGKKFRFPYEVVSHKRRHGPDAPRHPCTSCDKTFTNSNYLDKHVQQVHMGRYHVYCPECNKGFSNKSGMLKHLNVYHRDIRVPCEHCDKRFTCDKYMREHVARMHTPKQPHELVPLACTQCEHTCTTAQALQRHVRRIHINKTSFVCDVCGKCLLSRESLAGHTRAHAGIKPFKCTVCQRAFVKKSNLRIHMRTHTKERPHVCTECGKSFTQKQALNIHRRYHTGERPYTCTICEKRFVSLTQLKSHQKSHKLCNL